MCANTLISERHRQSQGAVMKWRINGNIGLVKFIEVGTMLTHGKKLKGKREMQGKVLQKW